MGERLTYLLLGMALIAAGLFALITDNAGERDYGDVVVVGMSGWGVRLIGLIMAVLGGYIVRTEFKALMKKIDEGEMMSIGATCLFFYRNAWRAAIWA